MEVILLERIEKLGAIGDVVKVKNGYARNFLLPNGKALRANELNRKVFEATASGSRPRTPSAAPPPRTDSKSIDGDHRQAHPPGVEHRPALRLGLGAGPRRAARSRGPQGRQEPDRPRPADQGDRPPGRPHRPPPGGVGDHPRQRRPLAGRSRAPGAGRRRDGRHVREGRRRLHRGARSQRRAGRDRGGGARRRKRRPRKRAKARRTKRPRG